MNSQTLSSAPVLIVDLVSQFLNKLFEKDSKATQYLKHWDSFRPILTASPLEVAPAYSFINSMIVDPYDSYTSFTMKPSPTSIHIKPAREHTFTLLSGAHDALNNSFEAMSTLSQGEEKGKNRRHSTYDPKSHLSPGSLDLGLRKNVSHKPSQFSQKSFQFMDSPNEFGGNFATKDLLSDITHEDSFDYGRSFESPTYTLKDEFTKDIKQNLSLLTDLAKKLKDDVSNHSAKFVEGMNKKQQAGAGFLMEERSPLRKLKVYGTNDEPSGGSYNSYQPVSNYGTTQQLLGADYLNKLRFY